jgi:hypothetical protein
VSLQLALDLLPDVGGEGSVLGSTQIHLKKIIRVLLVLLLPYLVGRV